VSKNKEKEKGESGGRTERGKEEEEGEGDYKLVICKE
jgi:hypothetical protein